MARRKTCYELYIYGRIAARGDIDLIAGTLCVSTGTAQRMIHETHRPKGVELVALPVLYDYRGKAMSARQVAEVAGAKEASVVAAACNRANLRGHPVRKHEYDTFTVGTGRFEQWREEGRNRG